MQRAALGGGLALLLSMGLHPVAAQAPPGYGQVPDPSAQFGAPPGIPGTPGAPGAARVGIREVFAGTLAVVAQATGAATVAGLTQAIAGGLTHWFNRKANAGAHAQPGTPGQVPYGAAYPSTQPAYAQPGYAQPAYPQPAYPQPGYAQPGYPQPQAYPDTNANYAPPATYSPQNVYPVTGTDPTAAQYPTPGADPSTQGYPAAGADPSLAPYGQATGAYGPPADPTAFGDPAAPRYFDPTTGAPAAPSAYGTSPTAGAAGIYAGLAYEVHVLAPGGTTTPVDPATYEFRTGERFVLFYRPTLPGRIEVYNINPAGRQSLIDAADVAAAQLARLGPYEFTAMTGDEQLRLVLAPCSTPALVGATRDIVRVADTVPVAAALGLAYCGAGATRSIRAPRTRDIRKVTVDGLTGFALDPVSPAELNSGALAPREITIGFRHR